MTSYNPNMVILLYNLSYQVITDQGMHSDAVVESVFSWAEGLDMQLSIFCIQASSISICPSQHMILPQKQALGAFKGKLASISSYSSSDSSVVISLRVRHPRRSCCCPFPGCGWHHLSILWHHWPHYRCQIRWQLGKPVLLISFVLQHKHLLQRVSAICEVNPYW